ncbi:unnamed protein product [marine sediment metagenome]|uniref:Ferredoxin-like protein n=1 Tax=marine sediment metagenome TaxID=412755 RepID=X0YBY4_9ZZZZ
MLVTGERNRVGLPEKLFTVRRKSLKESHIRVDARLCRECLTRICTYVCPAGVYEWNEAEGRVAISYEDCLECGACRVACEMHSIEWSNPVWGVGICYRDS